jgi:hypothetical protein
MSEHETPDPQDEMRSPESVRALLDAGVSAKGVAYPSGYADVDDLLRKAIDA